MTASRRQLSAALLWGASTTSASTRCLTRAAATASANTAACRGRPRWTRFSTVRTAASAARVNNALFAHVAAPSPASECSASLDLRTLQSGDGYIDVQSLGTTTQNRMDWVSESVGRQRGGAGYRPSLSMETPRESRDSWSLSFRSSSMISSSR